MSIRFFTLLIKPSICGLQQKYSQVNENFLKSEHPAVARTKPRLSSPFPIANPAFGSPTQVGLSNFLDPYNQNTNARQFRHEAEAQEVVTSFNEYIIPIPDPKPEEAFTDVPSESPDRYGDAGVLTQDHRTNWCIREQGTSRTCLLDYMHRFITFRSQLPSQLSSLRS